MIRNGKDIADGTALKTQVCVIGSGPAGITAAWELSQAGLDVILLDGSRQVDYSEPEYFKQSWNDKVKLYGGKADGVFSPFYEPDPTFLTRPSWEVSDGPWERERAYGGTSTHWGGQSRPLDELTFEKRSGFPGWPITRQDLDPYYARFCTLNHYFGGYGENGTNFTAEFWQSELGLENAIPHLEGFHVEMYQYMGKKWLNFATRTFDGQTIGESAVHVIVNATLLNIVEQGGSVQHLEVASMNDDPDNPQKATEFTVTADLYILACGAVANARQLLLSGIGNEMVGRYFMCHPLTQGQVITTTRQYLTDAQHNLMAGNTKDGVQWKDPRGDDGIDRISGRFTVDQEVAREEGIGRCWFWAYYGQMYFEMAPNFDSYVALADTLDPVFHQPETHVHWSFTELDQKTYETNCRLFQQASGNGISWQPWDQISDQWTINGHHLGTTRMSASTAPEDGVVDQNLKVHGVDNLYVAGSSVFPTAGIPNPTMTIITLSIRLAEHIQLHVIKPKVKAAGVQ
jgi:choline dehydrogenase-like flavoprotein